MDIVDCRKDGGRKTGMGAMFETDKRTVEAFEAARQYAVSRDDAEFLLDLHDDNADLLDSIFIDSAGFQAITGEKPKSIRYYQRYDSDVWKGIKKYAQEKK